MRIIVFIILSSIVLSLFACNTSKQLRVKTFYDNNRVSAKHFFSESGRMLKTESFYINGDKRQSIFKYEEKGDTIISRSYSITLPNKDTILYEINYLTGKLELPVKKILLDRPDTSYFQYEFDKDTVYQSIYRNKEDMKVDLWLQYISWFKFENKVKTTEISFRDFDNEIIESYVMKFDSNGRPKRSMVTGSSNKVTQYDCKKRNCSVIRVVEGDTTYLKEKAFFNRQGDRVKIKIISNIDGERKVNIGRNSFEYY